MKRLAEQRRWLDAGRSLHLLRIAMLAGGALVLAFAPSEASLAGQTIRTQATVRVGIVTTTRPSVVFDNPQSFTVVTSEPSVVEAVRRGADASRRSEAVAGIRFTEVSDAAAVAAATADPVNVTICVGASAASGCVDSAGRNPTRSFTVVDGSSSLPNVRALTFDDEEAGVLAGVFAAASTPRELIAVVESGASDDVTRGFVRGVRRHRPSAHLVTLARSTESAQVWTEQNATALKRARLVFVSDPDLLQYLARDPLSQNGRRRWLIGSGADWYQRGFKSVLASVIRRYDVVVQDEIENSAELRKPTGVVTRTDDRPSVAPRAAVEVRYGVAAGGVDVVTNPKASKAARKYLAQTRREMARARSAVRLTSAAGCPFAVDRTNDCEV